MPHNPIQFALSTTCCALALQCGSRANEHTAPLLPPAPIAHVAVAPTVLPPDADAWFVPAGPPVPEDNQHGIPPLRRVFDTTEGTDFVLVGTARVTVTADGIRVSRMRPGSSLISATRVRSGWLFLDESGTVYRSHTFLGTLEGLSTVDAQSCAPTPIEASRGRLTLKFSQGSLWTTDGETPLQKWTPRGPSAFMTSAFSDAEHGVVLTQTGQAFFTRDGGTTLTPIDLGNSIGIDARFTTSHGLIVGTTDAILAVSDDGQTHTVPSLPEEVPWLAEPMLRRIGRAVDTMKSATQPTVNTEVIDCPTTGEEESYPEQTPIVAPLDCRYTGVMRKEHLRHPMHDPHNLGGGQITEVALAAGGSSVQAEWYRSGLDGIVRGTARFHVDATDDESEFNTLLTATRTGALIKTHETLYWSTSVHTSQVHCGITLPSIPDRGIDAQLFIPRADGSVDMLVEQPLTDPASGNALASLYRTAHLTLEGTVVCDPIRIQPPTTITGLSYRRGHGEIVSLRTNDHRTTMYTSPSDGTPSTPVLLQLPASPCRSARGPDTLEVHIPLVDSDSASFWVADQNAVISDTPYFMGALTVTLDVLPSGRTCFRGMEGARSEYDRGDDFEQYTFGMAVRGALRGVIDRIDEHQSFRCVAHRERNLENIAIPE